MSDAEVTRTKFPDEPSLLVKKYKETKRSERYKNVMKKTSKILNRISRICLLQTVAIAWYGLERKAGAGGRRLRQRHKAIMPR